MSLTNRRHFLITYDIADDKRRNKVFDALHDQGDHAQFSVFFCDLTSVELASLVAGLTSMIDQQKDQILVVDLGRATHELRFTVEALGKCYNAPVRAMII